MISKILNEIGLKVIKQEGDGQLLCVCPDCKTDHLYINSSNGLWDCKHGCGQGNLFQLVRKVTGWTDKQSSELLVKYGHKPDASSDSPAKPKNASWFSRFASQVLKATSDDLQKLCQIKQIGCETLLKYSPDVHKKKPIIAIPAYDPSDNSICGYLRVGREGQPVKLKEGKEEKYPAIGKHGLYGLPWLEKENSETIIFCEGWRDALAAIEAGYCATASSGGASTFKDNWLSVFRDKTVYIIMDADKPGQKAAGKAASKISSVTQNVFVVNLPYEVTKDHGKDLHDYLVGGKGDIENLLKEAKPYDPSQQLGDDVILIPNDELDVVADKINEYCREKINIIYHYNSIDGWSMYENNHYCRIIGKKEIGIFIRQCLLKCFIEVKEKQEDGSIETKYKRLKRKNQGFVKDVESFWQANHKVYLKPDLHATASLKGDLNPNSVISLKNGLLDFSVSPYKLHLHTPDFYTFNYLNFDWLDGKSSDMFTDFVIEITCGDPELFLLLKQWAGYLLSHSMAHQKFLLCYGNGANGKSVFFEVITALLGSQNCSTVPLSKFNDTHLMTQTYGKLANISDESSGGLDEAVETALKQHTGGTQVNYKKLYHDSFSAYPTAKIMFATNELPRFRDTSNGIWRRMLLVPFNAVIPEDKQDRNLVEKIKKTEMSGVLNWALEGYVSLQEMGCFIKPKACKCALEQYKRDVNPLIVFLEENFELTKSEFDKIETQKLRDSYEQWCRDHGHRPKNDTNVGIQINKSWPSVEKKRLRKGMGRSMYYTKLKLKDDSEYNNEI